MVFKPGAKYTSYDVECRLSHAIVLSPTFVLEYTRDLKDVFESRFNYD